MNFMRETEQYYDWLYKIVCGEWEPRNLSFHRLLMYLFNRDYIPACEMDICRATDGTSLRYRFASENDIPYERINMAFQGVPCSMLEMMVALAIHSRGAHHGRPQHGQPCGTVVLEHDRQPGSGCHGRHPFQRRARRTDPGPVYGSGLQPNGAGGLFTITRTSIDMRTIDIWYQLMNWLNENEF